MRQSQLDTPYPNIPVALFTSYNCAFSSLTSLQLKIPLLLTNTTTIVTIIFRNGIQTIYIYPTGEGGATKQYSTHLIHNL